MRIVQGFVCKAVARRVRGISRVVHRHECTVSVGFFSAHGAIWVLVDTGALPTLSTKHAWIISSIVLYGGIPGISTLPLGSVLGIRYGKGGIKRYGLGGFFRGFVRGVREQRRHN